MPVAQECNQNASVLIYVLPMYFSHALTGLDAHLTDLLRPSSFPGDRHPEGRPAIDRTRSNRVLGDRPEISPATSSCFARHSFHAAAPRASIATCSSFGIFYP